MKPLFLDQIETSLGRIWLLATGRGVCSIRFVKPRQRAVVEVPPGPSRKELVMGGSLMRKAGRQIQDYLAGKRTSPTVRIDPAGLSAFEKSVLRAVRGVPFGETRTYAQVAALVGQPRSTRRVQSFLSRNPIPILVPCHRIIGAKGLGHYVAGRRIKARLIELERGQIRLALGGTK
jgi:O-6-methylguanine DNA methyltransferase